MLGAATPQNIVRRLRTSNLQIRIARANPRCRSFVVLAFRAQSDRLTLPSFLPPRLLSYGVVFWYWLFVGPALLLAVFSLRGERRRAAYVADRLAAPDPADLPPATVIVPVKGADQELRDNLLALASLDYPDYELLIVANSAADLPPGVLPPRAKVVLAHGGDASTGEKVQNLQAAVRAARRHSAVFAFADSDGRPGPRWLRALVAPLSEPGVGASTGYRWFVPDPPRFWSLVRSVWDAVIAGRLGPGDNGFAWGGAMALRKDVFAAAAIGDAWKGTISDDFALAAAIHRAGLTIAFAPGALVPSYDRTTALGFLAWTRRQMLLTRIYSPLLWWVALLAVIFYCGAMAASVAAALAGHTLALAALAAQLAPGMGKAWNRATVAMAALPQCREAVRRQRWAHALLVPFATWMWLVALAASAFGRTIVWRGRSYKL
jgi:ceramide glucosyltransferase